VRSRGRSPCLCRGTPQFIPSTSKVSKRLDRAEANRGTGCWSFPLATRFWVASPSTPLLAGTIGLRLSLSRYGVRPERPRLLVLLVRSS